MGDSTAGSSADAAGGLAEAVGCLLGAAGKSVVGISVVGSLVEAGERSAEAVGKSVVGIPAVGFQWMELHFTTSLMLGNKRPQDSLCVQIQTGV